MVKKIPLQNGEFAIVDDEDYERCMEQKWYISTSKSGSILNTKTRKTLASYILRHAGDNTAVFLKDKKDWLNYSKSNLCIGLNSSSSVRGRGRKGTSKYKGVFWVGRKQRWQAELMSNGKRYYLGQYKDEDKAAEAYNKKILELDLDAYLNVIGEDNNASIQKGFEKVKQYRGRAKSGFKGVTKTSWGNRYQAVFSQNYKNEYLGSFNTPEQAAKAYDKKAYELYGEKAILNFPEDFNKE